MKWSWKIGEIAGIGIFIHATFLILIAFIGIAHMGGEGKGIADALAAIGFVLLLFVCIFLHELGHALAARRFGIKTRDITLLPIGGLARLERMPDKPLQELWVALAGPLVNVVIAAVLFAWLLLVNGFTPLSELGVSEGNVVQRLMIVNVFLVVFNLLPAFPMDGGRVLRAVLATTMDYTQATQIAAGVGQFMAFVFGFIGLFSNPFLVFIALFVYIGAAQESGMVQLKSSLSGIPVERAMLTEFHTLSPLQSLGDAVNLTLDSTQQDFPVVDDGRVVGILTQPSLVQALQQAGLDAKVADAMIQDFVQVDASDMLETAFFKLQECACNTLPALRGGKLVGLLTSTNLGEFLMFRAALKERAGAQPSAAPRQNA